MEGHQKQREQIMKNHTNRIEFRHYQRMILGLNTPRLHIDRREAMTFVAVTYRYRFLSEDRAEIRQGKALFHYLNPGMNGARDYKLTGVFILDSDNEYIKAPIEDLFARENDAVLRRYL